MKKVTYVPKTFEEVIINSIHKCLSGKFLLEDLVEDVLSDKHIRALVKRTCQVTLLRGSMKAHTSKV